MPKLPRKYFDIRTKKFTIGFKRIVFQTPVMEMMPEIRRTIITPMSRKMRNLRTLKGFAVFASAMTSFISLSQRYAPYLVTCLTIDGVKFVVLTIYVNRVPNST